MDKLLYLVQGLRHIEKFYGKCPAGKRGRPLSMARAAELEKAAPGSVCAKEAAARRGVNSKGERTLLYRVSTYGTRLKERLEKEMKEKNKKGGKKKETAGGVSGASAKQAGFAKKVSKDMGDMLKQAGGEYAGEALKNLADMKNAGDILERKGLDVKLLTASLLSPKSLKEFASKNNIDLTGKSQKQPKNFSRIVKRVLKDDKDFGNAQQKGEKIPVGSMELQPADQAESQKQPIQKEEAPKATDQLAPAEKKSDKEIVAGVVDDVLSIDDGELLEKMSPGYVQEQTGHTLVSRLWGQGKDALKKAKTAIRNVKQKAIEAYLKSDDGKELVELIRANKTQGKKLNKKTLIFIAKKAFKYGQYLSFLGI